MQRRSPNRVNVHLDGEFAFGLARIVTLRLRAGQEFYEERMEDHTEQAGYLPRVILYR